MTDIEIRGKDISDDGEVKSGNVESTATNEEKDSFDKPLSSNVDGKSCSDQISIENPRSISPESGDSNFREGSSHVSPELAVSEDPSMDEPMECADAVAHTYVPQEYNDEESISDSPTHSKEEIEKENEKEIKTKNDSNKDNSESEELDYGEDSTVELSSPQKAIPSAEDISDGELSDSGASDIHKSEDKEKEEGEMSEKEEGELEEGEIEDSDDDELPPKLKREEEQSRAICKHYLRGSCSWDRCNFYHPPGMGGSQKKRSISPSRGTSPRRHDPPRPALESSTLTSETPWERGMREARERVKKASKKKQEDPEFDQKRLLLPPSDEKDWKHYSDEESGARPRDRAGRIPSLLDLRMSPPRLDRDKRDRYRGYDVPKDLGPQCIYPSGRPEARRRSPTRRVRRDSATRPNRNVRSRSPPPRPDPVSDVSDRSRTRSPPRRPLDPVVRRTLKSDETPYDPWARKKKLSPLEIDSDERSRRSYSRSSESSVDSRKRERSPPTGDITSYRIPKKKMGGIAREERTWTYTENNRGNYGAQRGRGNMNNGRGRRDLGNPNREKLGTRRGRVINTPCLSANTHSSRPPPPPDLVASGLEAVSDDEKSASSASSRSRSSSSGSSSSSRSSSSSSSSSSSRSRSNSPALPAKYRMTNTDIKEKEPSPSEKNVVSKKRAAVNVSLSPSPPPAKRKVAGSDRKMKPRSPSCSPPPPPPREETPPPPPNEKARENNRGRERTERMGKKGVERTKAKTKEELIEELRRVEEQLLRKRRAQAS